MLDKQRRGMRTYRGSGALRRRRCLVKDIVEIVVVFKLLVDLCTIAAGCVRVREQDPIPVLKEVDGPSLLVAQAFAYTADVEAVSVSVVDGCFIADLNELCVRREEPDGLRRVRITTIG